MCFDFLYKTVWNIFHSKKKWAKNNNIFKVCNSVHRRTIQINHQPHETIFQFIILTFIYSSTYFERFPAHHQELNDCSGSLWFYLRIVVIAMLCSWSGRPARPRPTALLPLRSNVKPEAATAIIELLMMGMRMPEACWAVFKRQVINLWNCCIWLVDSFECMMMHGLANPKLKSRIVFIVAESVWLVSRFYYSSVLIQDIVDSVALTSYT
jgi:hypothetical protein